MYGFIVIEIEIIVIIITSCYPINFLQEQLISSCFLVNGILKGQCGTGIWLAKPFNFMISPGR